MKKQMKELVRSKIWTDLVAVNSTDVTIVLNSVCSECPVHKEGKGLDRCCDAPKNNVWVTEATAKKMFKALDKEKNGDDAVDDVIQDMLKQSFWNKEDADSIEDLMDIKKFKSLFLKECIKIAKKQSNPHILNYKPSEKFTKDLKKHFGLKNQ